MFGRLSQCLSISNVSARTRQLGQGMTEYIIIVALVSVAAIAVYQFFGQVLRSQTAAMAKELAGEDGTAQTRNAKKAAEGAAKETTAKSLKSFTGNASTH
jgi:type IV pilus assembly protein PilA